MAPSLGWEVGTALMTLDKKQRVVAAERGVLIRRRDGQLFEVEFVRASERTDAPITLTAAAVP